VRASGGSCVRTAGIVSEVRGGTPGFEPARSMLQNPPWMVTGKYSQIRGWGPRFPYWSK